MTIASFIRATILHNRTHPTLRNRLRALHINRRYHKQGIRYAY